MLDEMLEEGADVAAGGRALRTLRLAKGLPAGLVADRVCRSRSAISQYESGRRTPTRGTVRVLCRRGIGATVDETNAVLLAYEYTPIGDLLQQVRAVLDADPCLTPTARAQIGAMVAAELAVALPSMELLR